MYRPWPRAALMSPAHFSRKFRAAYGETPYSYLMTRRIERAKALLRQGMSVTDTCFAVGCTSLGSFSSRFTEIVGETPSQYRARDHRDLEVVPPCVSKVATRPRRTPCRRPEQDRRSIPGAGARTVVVMAVTVSTMFIPVHDPDEALGFYRDALGLEVRNDVASDGFRWVTVGAPSQDVDIVLFQPHGGRSAGRGRRPPVARDEGLAAGRDLPLRRPRHHVREGPGVGRRGAAGADVPALGRARLRVPRPLGQHGPHRAGLTVGRSESMIGR